ncbi:MAG: methylenetetrahydrofolate reductase [NAD(P)H] [Candidatus Omnitrophica bacterium]|nr:methylenetetrahydrofolate reductase [NAD(P)H] [Candidatus Omnitrophota bacterium]
MRLTELYRSGKPDVSIELFPPKTPEAVEKLFETVEQLKSLRPVFFSMTFGAAGSTRDLTLDLCDRLKNRSKVETMCHLNIIGQSREETLRNLKRLKEAGIYNLLALRGDPPKDQPNFKPHPEGFRSSVELIEEAHRDPWFSIAVTGFPEVHPEAQDRASDIAYLKRKIEAGGCVVITQLFLDNSYFFEFIGLVRKAGIAVPVVPGILPILSVPQVRKFAALCGSTLPVSVERELVKVEGSEEGAVKYGIDLATRQCEELLKAGVPGLHFYALNRARSTKEILSNLRLGGVK